MWKHITKEDRREISILKRKGYKQVEISRELDIKENIISKELKRNSNINAESGEREYVWNKAQMKHYQRRRWAKPQSMKINSHTPLKLFLIWELKKKVPPKTIAHVWNHKEDNEVTITHGSIYKWLETWEWNKYKKYLLHEYAGYKKKSGIEKVIIPQRVWIEERCVLINERQEQWHYEADLIVSKKWYKGVLLTLIDRCSRKWLVLKLPNKTTKGVMRAIARHRKKLWIKSITFDNWKEFSHHYKLWKHGIKTYFCNPYSSWEKWSVENFNRIIRRWFPKWTVFDYISHQKIRSVMILINNTPREILGYLSPNQVHIAT
jgi:IS30 family transposase